MWRLRGSGGDVVTNVWKLGGHTSALTCVAFDAKEQALITGSDGGSLKQYDLSAGKVARTLNGHRAGVTSVHPHPFGEFVVSGGTDTHVKIWDMRKRACIQTYKGHAGGIRDRKSVV